MNGQAIKGIQIHNQREKKSETNPDIREEDKHLNYDFIHGDKQMDYKQQIQHVIAKNVKPGKKIRKDAVLVTEFLVTSDKPFFDKLSPNEQKRYFETTKDFLAKRYGEQNLIYATVHNDEKTPHMHVGIVPVTEDGRLSAKEVVGNRMQLVKLQDDFNAHVKALGYDLERGVSSNRKHVEMAKFKAMTSFETEQEAAKNYEKTISRIQSIQKTSKALDDVKGIQQLGRVLLKKDEYDALVNHAISGAVAEQEVIRLEEKLKRSEHQVVQLKDEMQKGQDEVRKLYKGIEVRSEETKIENENIKVENKNINENLNELAEQKAKPIALKLADKHLQELDVVKKNKEIVSKYNNLIDKYNQLLDENTTLEKTSKSKIGELEFEIRVSNREYNDLSNDMETQTRGWKKENDGLRIENNLLREQIKEIRNEFQAFKERIIDVLNMQFSRIKTWLNVNRIEPQHIKFLDGKQERIIEDSLKELEKPLNQEKELEIEMER
jgi:hypothetical protein